MDLLLNKAHLIGISDLDKWSSWIELEGEVQHVSRSKEGRREAHRAVSQEGPHTVVEISCGLTDSERAYLSVYQEQ